MDQFKNTSVQLLISEVVASEVCAHLVESMSQAETKFRSSIEEVCTEWGISTTDMEAVADKVLAGKKADEHAQVRWKTYLDTMGVMLVPAEGRVTTKELLRRYFGTEPPFEEGSKKKSEFPDAMSLLALEHWAAEKGGFILAVSRDRGWHSFCADSNFLVAINELRDALSLFNASADFVCTALSKKFDEGELEDLKSEIEYSISEKISAEHLDIDASSSFYYDQGLGDVEVDDFEFLPPQDGKPLFRPIQYEEGNLVAALSVSIRVTVDVDFTFSVRDGIDKDLVSIGSTTVTREKSIEVEVLVSLNGELLEDPEVADIEVELPSLAFDFGEIGPDWTNYEDD